MFKLSTLLVVAVVVQALAGVTSFAMVASRGPAMMARGAPSSLKAASVADNMASAVASSPSGWTGLKWDRAAKLWVRESAAAKISGGEPLLAQSRVGARGTALALLLAGVDIMQLPVDQISTTPF